MYLELIDTPNYTGQNKPLSGKWISVMFLQISMCSKYHFDKSIYLVLIDLKNNCYEFSLYIICYTVYSQNVEVLLVLIHSLNASFEFEKLITFHF